MRKNKKTRIRMLIGKFRKGDGSVFVIGNVARWVDNEGNVSIKSIITPHPGDWVVSKMRSGRIALFRIISVENDKCIKQKYLCFSEAVGYISKDDIEHRLDLAIDKKETIS